MTTSRRSASPQRTQDMDLVSTMRVAAEDREPTDEDMRLMRVLLVTAARRLEGILQQE